MRKEIGAPERSKLEPDTIDATLQILEDWAEILKQDEVLLQTLARFEDAGADRDDNEETGSSSTPSGSSS